MGELEMVGGCMECHVEWRESSKGGKGEERTA